MEEYCKTCLYKDGSCYPSYNIYSKEKKCKSYEPDPYDKIADLEKQLEQAKKIIKKLRTLYFSPVVTNDDVKRQDEILNEVEQFLKESNNG